MKVIVKPHEEDPPLACTVGYLKHTLKQEPFWHDLQNWLRDRIRLHTEVTKSSDDISDIRRSQAIIANCEDILELPSLWLQELQDGQEEET